MSASAAVYRAAVQAGGSRVEEREPAASAGNELELQARWFAGEFGRDFVTTEGAAVRIEDFGRWNHEAGPDFIGARVRIGGEAVRGAIEIDPDVRDWERHGHATNVHFRETVLHVFVRQGGARFFTRTCDHRQVPQVRLTLPPAPSRKTLPVPEPVTTDARRAERILHAAARHRLALKAGALSRHAAVRGWDEAWFAALAVALGYRRNRTPFALLAQRVTREAACESLLFGVAGFLEAPDPPAAEPEVRAYLRALWEEWWAVRARCERWILPGSAWQFGGVRPANHPHRRVAVLAEMSRRWTALRETLAGDEATDLEKALAGLAHPFWESRFNLAAARLRRPAALLGAERIRDIVINVFYPSALERSEEVWPKFLAERGAAPAAVMRETARRFFGGLPAGFLARAVVQQGLLQIERDHGLAPDPAAFRAALRRASGD